MDFHYRALDVVLNRLFPSYNINPLRASLPAFVAPGLLPLWVSPRPLESVFLKVSSPLSWGGREVGKRHPSPTTSLPNANHSLSSDGLSFFAPFLQVLQQCPPKCTSITST